MEGYCKKVLAIHKVKSIGFLSITQFPPSSYLLSHYCCQVLLSLFGKKLLELLSPQKNQMY
jgi:hypothetical protein